MSKTGMRAKRVAAYRQQGGLCFYCRRPMWERSIESKIEASLRIGIRWGSEGAKKAFRHVVCTAEHLKRVADGGGNQRQNIVAACSLCNATRGTKTPDVHKRIPTEACHG